MGICRKTRDYCSLERVRVLAGRTLETDTHGLAILVGRVKGFKTARRQSEYVSDSL